jgi:carboxyl-terminal processing protease
MPRFAILCHLAFATIAFSQSDLAAKYPPTIDRTDPPKPLEWAATKDDVWQLSSVNIAAADGFRITSGPATVVFGHHNRNVLWAAVFPDQPGTLASPAAGNGDAVAHIWLRPHPARIGELFPNATVIGPGDERFVALAKRMCAWKIRGSMQSGDLPVCPQREWTIFDLDTTDAVRRFFVADSKEKAVKYEGAFEKRAMPPLAPIENADATKIFDQVWGDFDREYAMFGLRPDVDWSKLRDQFRPRAEAARTTYELAAVLSDLLTNLKDLHIFVRVGDEFVPGYNRPRPGNASFDGTLSQVGGIKQRHQDMLWGRTDDGIGYVNIFRLNDADLPKDFDRALDALADTWALIVDLRFNGGGDETLAQRIASRFSEERRTYSISQFRSGPAHSDLGEGKPRQIEPRGPWLYRAPVIALTGQKTMSSAESFALMLAQCPQVTTMGDRTAGSSGNPRTIELAGKIAVNLPRWIDLDPDGKPIDTVGVAPRLPIATKESDFTATADPVIVAALKRLREVPAADRKAGKRD